ncbi:MAG TPA: arsenate reductase ArsC [Candidatus Bathyarchaeia archaeon]|nr:arsenate reductase ArsC [Candidatus Bathyarchaeia archaeon]
MKKAYFICIGNSGRSQIAEGYAKHFGQGILEVQSAGTKPADRISSNAVEVMKEDDIDISSQYPKKIDFEYAKTADYVIIMGCGAENMCPAWFITKSENWDLEDPHGQNIEFYRIIRDEIKKRVLDLIENI